MATNFPSSLDSFTNPSAADALDSVSVPHADQHANINDAMEAVQAKLGTGSGTIGTWTSYTPTLFGFTCSAVDARYAKINDVVHVTFQGIVSAVTAQMTVSLPVTSHSPSVNGFQVIFVDAGTTIAIGTIIGTSATTIGLYAQWNSSTFSQYYGTSSSVPFTWAANDVVYFQMTYKAA